MFFNLSAPWFPPCRSEDSDSRTGSERPPAVPSSRPQSRPGRGVDQSGPGVRIRVSVQRRAERPLLPAPVLQEPGGPAGPADEGQRRVLGSEGRDDWRQGDV